MYFFKGLFNSLKLKWADGCAFDVLLFLTKINNKKLYCAIGGDGLYTFRYLDTVKGWFRKFGTVPIADVPTSKLLKPGEASKASETFELEVWGRGEGAWLF